MLALGWCLLFIYLNTCGRPISKYDPESTTNRQEKSTAVVKIVENPQPIIDIHQDSVYMGPTTQNQKT